MRELALALSPILLWSRRPRAHVGNPDVYFQGAAGAVSSDHHHPHAADDSRHRGRGNFKRHARHFENHCRAALHRRAPARNILPSATCSSNRKKIPQYFFGKIWLMESGSWQIRVQVEGAQGAGELAVPVPAAARRTLPMQKSLGILLFALMSLAGRRDYFNCGRGAP